MMVMVVVVAPRIRVVPAVVMVVVMMMIVELRHLDALYLGRARRRGVRGAQRRERVGDWIEQLRE